MKRFNIFNQIHKALRAALYDTALTLQQTSFEEEDQAAMALEKVNLVADLFDKHAGHEDHFIIPAIQQYEPSVADAFEQEHVEDHALGQKLRGLLLSFEHAVSTEEKIIAGQALTNCFIHFMTFNLTHMAKEEVVLNELLWRYYNDGELLALNHKIVTSIPAAEAVVAQAWMMRGLSNTEIIAWLRAVEKSSPEFIFNALFASAEKELPPVRFRQVLEGLTNGVLVA
ncbi:MAG TPA: hypothetical protein VFS36_14890 [Chitinophagaceae bacterium]|nr:hypothetical protein [Chitinophagaceae bacterium]